MVRRIHSSPSRKESFEKWAWYLKLAGEDESDTKGHRKGKRKVKKAGFDQAIRNKDEKIEWSWVGMRSPLMGGKGESE